MLNYFLKDNEDIIVEHKYIPNYDYTRRKVKELLHKTLEYFSEHRESKVNNTNLLNRIVKHYPYNPFDFDIFRWYKLIKSDYEYVAKYYKLTDETNYGILHKDLAFKNSYSGIFSCSNFIDFDKLEKHWRRLESCKVVYNSSTVFNWGVMDSRSFHEHNDVEHIVNFELDIVMMMCQYWHWIRYRDELGLDTGSEYFIKMIVLPNLNISNIDIVMFTRFLKEYLNSDIEYSTFESLPTINLEYIFNIENLIKNVVNEYIEVVKKFSIVHIDRMISYFPCLVNRNMRTGLKINQEFISRDNSWLIWLSRIDYIQSFLEIIGKTSLKDNYKFFSGISSELKLLSNNGTNLGLLPKRIRENFMSTLYNLQSIIDKI